MILPLEDLPDQPPRQPSEGAPWSLRPEAPAFATLWASGPDPARDGLFRVAALRRRADGTWERFGRWCRPFADEERTARATQRMAREFGVTSGSLEGARAPAEALAELAGFLGERTVVVPEPDALRAWSAALLRADAAPLQSRVLSLSAVAAALAPGRLASFGEALAARLLGAELEARPRALEPEHLRRALAMLLERVLAADEASLALLACGYRLAWQHLREEDPRAAEQLAFLLMLAERPSVAGDASEPLAGPSGLDGRLSDAVLAYETLDAALDAAVPACGREARSERRVEGLAAIADDVHVLGADDRRRVDEIFQVHLPRLLAERGDPSAAARPAQHVLAAEIAARFGERELLLLHAPTGTGKTLAYLVPTLLWAYREGVRVGVATFTRALQEQAMERDVPLALELLRRAGVEGAPRVTLLKGRENYLCWRALRQEIPSPLEPAEDVLAWTALALFGLSDPAADLDRFPLRPPLEGHEEGRAALARAVRRARAALGCCTHQADRDSCGADSARRRASGAHLVITNHAFALARREFFRHLVFDECEHLHDVAHNAFSHTVTVRGLRELLERLYRPGTGRTPLGRLSSSLSAGTDAAQALEACLEAHEAIARALGELDRALADFHVWRSEAERTREEKDQHSLFREYVRELAPRELLEAHAALATALNDLAAGLGQLSEFLDADAAPREQRERRARRSLDVLRTELEERLAAVLAWIPRHEGAPSFRSETFYDLEKSARGDDVLAARVLLPHEYLGQQYYPDLFGAVFLSATTWLGDGFEAQAGFLGLSRAATPREDEERLPARLATFRAEETFDYGRVVLGVPRDAPSVRERKDAFLDYVTRFLAFLAERTRGRVLALFTNAEDVLAVGRGLSGFLLERHLPLWYQGMPGASKEELSELFRATTDSVLLGVDTFWYGADFPGHTLEYLVLVRLPYGVPDHYHHAQCAAIGAHEQRRAIYMPRALSKFRQGFGRLMRRESDKGCVFVLDNRVLDPRHRAFLRELPLANPFEEAPRERLARLVVGDTDRILHEAFAHMDMLSDVRKRGLERSFRGFRLAASEEGPPSPAPPRESPPVIAPEDLPF